MNAVSDRINTNQPFGVDPFDIASAAIDAYIAALGETHAIVPREPTEAMLRAGDSLGSYGDERRYLTDDELSDIYRAMLNAAAPQRTEQA